MIIRDKPKPWELLFIIRGSIIPKIWPQLLAVFVLSLLVTVSEAHGLIRSNPILPLPFSLIGIALSIFAGFRNSASYERWWEARKLIGQMVMEARSLSRQAHAYLDNSAAETVTRQTIAFVHGWRMPYDEYMQWADTTFKRLWQLGYKGRFYTFRWPT